MSVDDLMMTILFCQFFAALRSDHRSEPMTVLIEPAFASIMPL